MKNERKIIDKPGKYLTKDGLLITITKSIKPYCEEDDFIWEGKYTVTFVSRWNSLGKEFNLFDSRNDITSKK